MRLIALSIVVPATFYFIYWVPFSLLNLNEYRWIASTISFLVACLAGWLVWNRIGSSHPGAISNILIGAVLFGGIGFSAGFFGPIILTPEANQGPLLGIFITGPLGFILGGIGGLIYWIIKRRTRADHQ